MHSCILLKENVFEGFLSKQLSAHWTFTVVIKR